MALLSGLFAVALFVPNAKVDLPLGTWKVQVEGEVSGDLVITEVKPDGRLCGTVFGKPLAGTWDGTVLSFHVSHVRHSYDRYSSFSARLVQEKQGTKVRYTLTGTETGFISGCYIYEYLPPRGWKAHLEAPDNKK
jgi:hypothetical protein